MNFLEDAIKQAVGIKELALQRVRNLKVLFLISLDTMIGLFFLLATFCFCMALVYLVTTLIAL